MSLLDEAIVFAVQAHRGMTRKGSDIPFILHPLEAAAIAAAISTKDEVLAAAVLHDVVEDTSHTLEEIEARFGPTVAALVAQETEQKRPGLPAGATWQLRKEETIVHLQTSAGYEAKLVTLADKLSNLRSMYRDWEKEGNALWSRFHQQDPTRHCWYYYEVGLALDCFSSHPAMKEYWYLFHQLWPDHPVPLDVLQP